MPRAQIIRRSRLFFQFKAPSGRDANRVRAINSNCVHANNRTGQSKHRLFASTASSPGGRGAIFCARTINATSWAKIIGCLRSPSHSEPCEDFHHNSSIFKAAVTRLGRTRCITSLQEYELLQQMPALIFHLPSKKVLSDSNKNFVKPSNFKAVNGGGHCL